MFRAQLLKRILYQINIYVTAADLTWEYGLTMVMPHAHFHDNLTKHPSDLYISQNNYVKLI